MISSGDATTSVYDIINEAPGNEWERGSLGWFSPLSGNASIDVQRDLVG